MIVFRAIVKSNHLVKGFTSRNLINNFGTSASYRYPRTIQRIPPSVSDSPLNNNENSLNKNEFEIIEDIETKLFENSSRIHKPVKAKEILQSKNKLKKGISKPKFEKEARTKNEDSEKEETTKIKEKSPIIYDTDLEMNYIRLSPNDPKIHVLLTVARSKKCRDKKQLIVVEGRRLIVEAVQAGLNLQVILYSRKEQLLQIKDTIRSLGTQPKVYKVPHHNLQVWSTLSTCPGLIAICERPISKNLPASNENTFPVSVICDNIREPNNLGSIIRTCAAIPCAQVIVIKGCCDPWETKALRGGCGGQFRVQIKDDVTWDSVEKHLPENYDLHVAENNTMLLRNKNIIPYNNINISEKNQVVIIGGETHGISEAAYNFLEFKNGDCLHIPMAQGIDSLNTSSALTLILYEIRKHLEKKAYVDLHGEIEENRSNF